MAEGELTPEQRIRLSETLTKRAQQCLTRADRDKTRSVRDASLLAQRAIEVLPREPSVERSKAHYMAEKLLRELGTPGRPRPAEAARLQCERLAKMWHPTLNGNKRFEDIPGASVGKYWWRCVEVGSHDQPWLGTAATAKKRTACPACAEAQRLADGRRRKKGRSPQEKRSQSVWTTSGGLPTLGRRR
jgi:Probable Zinc-ribbon domain